jgi:D-glycero-alpha-D-manno-heptose-7-phosphate kinase
VEIATALLNQFYYMVISKTPLRLSFVGGGTDFAGFFKHHQGQVISAAIDKYIYVIVKKRFDDLIVLHYTENEIVESVSEIKHEIIRETLLHIGIEKGIEIITLADITTRGSGLGSSSVLTVGLLNALYQYKGMQVSSEQLAKEACEIEIKKLNKPIGKQDQYIAAYGGIKKIRFYPDDTVTLTNIPFSDTDKLQVVSNLLLHNTGIVRKADTILQEQENNVSNRTEELLAISKLVDRLEEAWLSKKWEALGDLLRINWDMKKKLAKDTTNEKISEMVNIATGNGATGCKIAGAGGGGFLMSYVPKEEQERYRNAMSVYPELHYRFDPSGSRIILNA